MGNGVVHHLGGRPRVWVEFRNVFLHFGGRGGAEVAMLLKSKISLMGPGLDVGDLVSREGRGWWCPKSEPRY